MSERPDPRLLEDVIVAGEVAIKRARRDMSEASRLALNQAVAWLLARVTELRQEQR